MSKPRSATRTRVIIALGVVGAISCVVLWRYRIDLNESSTSEKPAESLALPAAQEAENADAPLASMGALDPRVQRDVALQSLEQYRLFSMYPPWSRPADGSQEHIVEWNHILPLTLPLPVEEGGTPLHAEARLDRMFARPGERITITLDAWQEGTDGERTPAAVRADAEIQVYDEAAAAAEPDRADAGWRSAGEVALTASAATERDSQQGGFVPSSLDGLGDGSVDTRVVVWVATAAGSTPFLLPFRHVRESAVEIVGLRSEGIREGSLEVTLDVDVREPGPVLYQAALFDADGRVPIAVYDGYVRAAKAGRQPVDLVFFGRAIRESAIDGPYRIASLHGLARTADERGREFYWADRTDRALVTRAYRAADFSEAHWDAPEKREKLQQYDEFLGGLPTE